jgi:hypothetical protein
MSLCSRCSKRFKDANGLAKHLQSKSKACSKAERFRTLADQRNNLENFMEQDAADLVAREQSDWQNLTGIQMAELDALCCWDRSIDQSTCASIKGRIAAINKLRCEHLEASLSLLVQKALDNAGIDDDSTLLDISKTIREGLSCWQGTETLKQTEALRRKVQHAALVPYWNIPLTCACRCRCSPMLNPRPEC